MNFKKRMTTEQAGFQMAPMVDIIFLLLIFFMASSIFAQWERKLDIEVPTADSNIAGARQPGEIIVNLDDKGKLFVNNVELSVERLESLLGQVAKMFPDQPVIIRADAKTFHESVIEVLDICRKVDIRNVSFATLPGQEE